MTTATTAKTTSLLRVEGLKSYFYTRRGVVKAVNGISYEVNTGEVVGIVGESGCGKTVGALSLLRLLPSPPGRIVSGKVWLHGQDLLQLSDEELRRVRGSDVAMIFQDPMTSLNPVLTIGRQMTEGLQLHKRMSRRQARERAVELLRMVGIPSAHKRLDDFPHLLSGGMRQRVMIAMALSCEPSVLIADEPTTALDMTIQAQILDLLRDVRADLGMGVILITHDLGMLAGIADKVNVMYAGYIVESAPVRDLFADPRHPYTLGLLRSMPRSDRPRQDKLLPIQGSPPRLIDAPQGCPFVSRCSYAVERSWQENPKLTTVAPGHQVACWVDVRADTA
ncbi:MAG: ABC transporter ATP-binding protein [Actinomycetota bacterium]|nr:ABC transporter ATP-binding protein [Actinomycetota bacterium]